MALDSIKKLKLSAEQEASYRAWLAAQERYRAECALFQRINRQLPQRMEDCTMEQIVLKATARARYKAACKQYYTAQQEYNLSKSALKQPLDAEHIKDTLQQLVDSLTGVTPDAVRMGSDAMEHDALAARFGSIEKSPVLSTIAQVARERRQTQQAQEMQSLLGTTDEIEDPEGAAPEVEVDSPEDLIRKYGIPEAEAEKESE